MTILSAAANGAIAEKAANSPRPSRIGIGALCSLMLHVVAAVLLIFGLPSLLRAPAEVEEVVPVNLVEFAGETAAPPEEEKAPLPQAKAAEAAPEETPQPVPEAQVPPPAPAEAAGTKPAPKPPQQVAPRPRTAPPAPQNALEAQLRSLARLHQPPPQAPPNPGRQAGSGASNVDASSETASAANRATYSVKDFIRAQIEQRWNFDLQSLGSGDLAVTLHLVINRDGSVSKAEIVEDRARAADPAYRELAQSARNAALLSSPLKLPAGSYEAVADILLTMNPREVRR
ncbi:MAG TPA: hypothetical protein VMU06_14225 [Stellaceae bacterium]|nr:hypothetical protein [Stellaceae bacterium]